jgi:hypothetical protein
MASLEKARNRSLLLQSPRTPLDGYIVSTSLAENVFWVVLTVAVRVAL